MATAKVFFFERAKVKTSRKFATSPYILVLKGKNSVENVTVLVAISSPAYNLNTYLIVFPTSSSFLFAFAG